MQRNVGEEQIRIRFEGRYTLGIWRRLYKYRKKGLRQSEIIELMDKDLTAEAVKYWLNKINSL